MGIDEFLGKKYVLVKHENFEDYLVFLGKGFVSRKAALSLRPEHCLTKSEDGRYTFSLTSVMVSSSFTFTPGEEFDETKADGEKVGRMINGEKVRSTVTIEDNKMIHVQKEQNGRVSKHVREFYPDKLIITTTAEGLKTTVVRYHDLVK